MFSYTQKKHFHRAYENYIFLREFILDNADLSEEGAAEAEKLLMHADLELQLSLCDISSLDTGEITEQEKEFMQSLIESVDALKSQIPGYVRFYRSMTGEEYLKLKKSARLPENGVLIGVKIALRLKEVIGKNDVSRVIGAYDHIFQAYAQMNEFRKGKNLEKASKLIGVQAKAAGEIGIVYEGNGTNREIIDARTAPGKEGPSLEEYQGELANLVGLSEVKDDVMKILNNLRVNALRRQKGIAPISTSNHMVFTGNPGTGKTTVARILAGIYKHMGLLSKGHLVEVDRAGLVGAYVGATEEKTMQVIESAMGGVLFIDEAYSLAQKGNDFGQYAVGVLLKVMEDRREDLVVIVAGYPAPMMEFIESNPGLKSRFTKYISFPDYDREELHQIFLGMMKKDSFSLEAAAEKKLQSLWEKASTDPGFGNGRGVRNLYEEVVTNLSSRVIQLSDPSEDDLLLIKEEDIPKNYKRPMLPDEKGKRIGFL